MFGLETEWTRLLTEHWPSMTMVIVFLFGLYWCVRFLAMTFESFAGWLGPIGEYWRTRRLVSQTELDDMRRRLTYLDSQVRALRYRDECYFAFMLHDEEWHRRHELRAAEYGWKFDPHVSFLQFRDNWMRDRKIEDKDIDVWV